MERSKAMRIDRKEEAVALSREPEDMVDMMWSFMKYIAKRKAVASLQRKQ